MYNSRKHNSIQQKPHQAQNVTHPSSRVTINVITDSRDIMGLMVKQVIYLEIINSQAIMPQNKY